MRFFGTPEGIQVGQLFIDRRDLHESHVHRPLQAGISGSTKEGADSVVVSGGYADDQDNGDYIIYTGHGGKDPNSTKQVADQSITASGNAALITSQVLGLPVRVIRGAHRGSPYAPPAGLQYAGLFSVTEWWIKLGQHGFNIVQFRLERIPEQATLVTRELPVPDPAYATTTITRRIRDTALSRDLKTMYSNKCQVCGTSIPGIGDRWYSEGAHVRPLGRPHLGDDSFANILCLCPNHHTQLDIGGMIIQDDMTVTTRSMASIGEVTYRADHMIALSNLQYHRDHWLQTQL